MKALMTFERARAVFAYDPETGVITWAKAGKKAGTIAGHANKTIGYRTLWADGRAYLAHRVAWLLTHGEWPAGEIDHRNGNRSDNRLSNLRCVTKQVNCQNLRRAPSHNTSGYLGVTFCKCTGRWRAQIVINKKHIAIGRYDSPEMAYAAYVAAKRHMHEGCTL